MTDALILWALGRSKKLRFLKELYEAKLEAQVQGYAPVRVRGIRIDGQEFEHRGVFVPADAVVPADVVVEVMRPL